MRVLLVGSGGREHALAWKLAQSPLLDMLFIAPGNPGTARLGQNVPVSADAIPLLVDVARRERIELVVVGPEAPLAAGIVNAFGGVGIPVFGPSASAARIEGSKAFAKQLMQRAGVPTASAHIFDDPSAATTFVRASRMPWVVKADGLAGGKGVVVADDMEATVAAIQRLAQSPFGQRILLEQRLHGPEVSLIALCDGRRLLPLPPAQDYKRLLDGNAGPNTGGMGAYAPAADAGELLAEQIVERLMQPVVDTLAAVGTPFRGALYAGVILTEQGPQILEFNARFGDPEAQVILPLIEGDLLAAMVACTQGRLENDMLRWKAGAAVCVVLAADGYPESPRRGDAIGGVEAVDEPDVLVFHAGTDWQAGQLVTASGRVLGVTGLGRTVRAARDRAYEVVEGITFSGMHYRRDIGIRST